MIEDRLGLTKEYVNPIFCFCVELLSNSAIDVEKAIEQMQPNINVQVLGMIVFFYLIKVIHLNTLNSVLLIRVYNANRNRFN